jgi:hypothetical protein
LGVGRGARRMPARAAAMCGIVSIRPRSPACARTDLLVRRSKRRSRPGEMGRPV